MTWAQFWTIVATGLFAVLASGVGQWIAGSMAERRLHAEHERADKERFSEAKRELYQRAIQMLTVGAVQVGPIEVGGNGDRLFNLQVQEMIMSLGMFDDVVAKSFGHAWATKEEAFRKLRNGEGEADAVGQEVMAALDATRAEMSRSLGMPSPQAPLGKMVVNEKDKQHKQ